MTPKEHQDILDKMTPEQLRARQAQIDAIRKAKEERDRYDEIARALNEATRGTPVKPGDWRLVRGPDGRLKANPADSHDAWRELNEEDHA